MDKIFYVKIGFCVLIVIGFVGYHVYKSYKKDYETKPFPPFTSKCPDYWDVVGKRKCKNTKKMGICLHGDGTKDSDIMDFNDPIFQGKKGKYYKCSWAKKCKLSWEGIDKLCI